MRIGINHLFCESQKLFTAQNCASIIISIVVVVVVVSAQVTKSNSFWRLKAVVELFMHLSLFTVFLFIVFHISWSSLSNLSEYFVGTPREGYQFCPNKRNETNKSRIPVHPITQIGTGKN